MLNDYTLVLSQQIQLNETIFEMTLKGHLTQDIRPGQFVNVTIPDQTKLLRRPFGVAEVCDDRQGIKLIYRVVGSGTETLAHLAVGTKLQVLGPLGNGFSFDFLAPISKVLIVSGGTGLPPLYQLTKTLSSAGHHLDIAMGFPDKSRVFYESKMRAFGHTAIITDDGSYGAKGDITDLLKTTFPDKDYDAIYACGPKGLELAVSERFKGHPHAYVSAEARMACGIGICNACVLHATNDFEDEHYQKVCTDGPVFSINEVIL